MSTEHTRANRDGQAVIRTLVRHTNSGEDVRAAHVLERDQEGYLELREHVPLGSDESMYVGLRPPQHLVEGQAMALPVHRIEVDWSSRTAGEWRLEEGLALLAQELSEDAQRM